MRATCEIVAILSNARQRKIVQVYSPGLSKLPIKAQPRQWPRLGEALVGKKGDGMVNDYTQGSQSTLMAPHVELPQSWMNFTMEKTPVRSSTDLPYSAWRPLSWLSARGSREIHPMWATPITLLLRLASRTPVQQAGHPDLMWSIPWS